MPNMSSPSHRSGSVIENQAPPSLQRSSSIIEHPIAMESHRKILRRIDTIREDDDLADDSGSITKSESANSFLTSLGSSVITFTQSTQGLREQLIEFIHNSQFEPMSKQEMDEEMEDVIE